MLKYFSVIIIVATVLASCADGSDGAKHGVDPNAQGLNIDLTTLTTTVDPVCKMDMANFKITDTVHHHGGIYVFCSDVCKEEFLKDPHQYLGAH